MADQLVYRNPPPQIRLSRILLPAEHGAWSFLVEPLLVGCIVAASPAAPWVVVMVTAAFFARQPLKVQALVRANPYTASLALRFFWLFISVALIGLLGTVFQAGVGVLFPLVMAAPFEQVQVFADVSGRSRRLSAELAGAIAIAASSATLALAAGFSWPAATALWLIFACRFTASILYVRNRLLLEKGKPCDKFWAFASHSVGVVLVGYLAFMGLASWLTAAVFVVLLTRSVLGLSRYRVKMKAMKIGIWEVVYGILTAGSIIVGFLLGI